LLIALTSNFQGKVKRIFNSCAQELGSIRPTWPERRQEEKHLKPAADDVASKATCSGQFKSWLAPFGASQLDFCPLAKF